MVINGYQCGYNNRKRAMTGNGEHIPTIYGDFPGGWFMTLLYPHYYVKKGKVNTTILHGVKVTCHGIA